MADRYLDRLWDMHVVASLPGGVDLIHVDRHLLHDLTGALAFSSLKAGGRSVRHPELTWGVVDHLISSKKNRAGPTIEGGPGLIEAFEQHTAESGVRLFGPTDRDQGIVHIVSAEQGIALPGLSVLCIDSHACTVGALGALAWGIGVSEAEHILATQTIRATRRKLMRVEFNGKLPQGVGGKDLILALIARIGTSGGRGYALEYDGDGFRALSVEDRMTLCNMAIEAGSEIAIVRPDEETFEYCKGRAYAPKGEDWDKALATWRALADGCEKTGDELVMIDVSRLTPQVTWGTSPQQVIGIADPVPDPAGADDRVRSQMERALSYMGLKPGDRLSDFPIQHVFIGSCTNARIGDLRRAAVHVKGHKVAEGVRAMVVPGSGRIRRQAEEEGLAQIFIDAGFEWREPGCSMCAAVNGDMVGVGERCVATSNRNFEGRQGERARTHLASPEIAAASAVAGRIVDPWRETRQ